MGTNRDHLIGLLASRLETVETRFGGLQQNVPRVHVSRFDQRSPQQLKRGGMQGGDRMVHHGYASHYAQHLLPLVERGGKDMVIVELGILRGSGLALLCEVFPRAKRVIGLDVDTGHFETHQPKLVELGAFRKRVPEIRRFDELAPDAPERFAEILGGDQVNVFIHDALHYDGAIVRTLEHAHRHFAPRVRCFVEDNDRVSPQLVQAYGNRFAVAPYGRLTVLWRD